MLQISAVKGRKQAEFDQKLKAVADAENQPAVIDKGQQLFDQRSAGFRGGIFPALSRGLGRAEVVAVQKSAGKNKKIICADYHAAFNNIGKMRYVGVVNPGQARGMGAFDFAIGAVPGDHERAYSNRHEISYLSVRRGKPHTRVFCCISGMLL
jgi:hypothetical protein